MSKKTLNRKLYKFRSLADCVSGERVERILRSGKFWCSKFWELNDPMEGIYQLDPDISRTDIEQLFRDKANYLICSFSGEEALQCAPMWGYYANGFKGVAIEVDRTDPKLKQISYDTKLAALSERNLGLASAENILRRKLKGWEHEHEWRYIVQDARVRYQEVGTITGVVIGHSYPKAFTHPDSDDRWEQAKQYQRRVERVVEVAKSEKLTIYKAQMKYAKVEILPWDGSVPEAVP